MSAGGGVATGLLSGWLKVWLVPTIGLTIVGGPAMGAEWSDLWTDGSANAAGVAVKDGQDMPEVMEAGTAAADAEDASEGGGGQ